MNSINVMQGFVRVRIKAGFAI